jgi:murein DD-endopeptidase MepM/ murein hydrolase activator NlpD
MSEGLVNCLKEAKFHKLIPFDASKDKLILLDFTENNPDLTDNILLDTAMFSEYIHNKLELANARYGIGGYAEHRTIYKRSELFNATKKIFPNANEIEPRRFHLGMDIWGKPFTPVMAPLKGMVHSFAFNNAFGDYGATIILSHRLDNYTFYTLYGHLSLASIKNLNEGDTINKGEVFAEFGTPQENGNWPPHLHFQIIKNLQGMKGDYPGVCKYSEKDIYMDNCPYPDLILGMIKYARVISQY